MLTLRRNALRHDPPLITICYERFGCEMECDRTEIAGSLTAPSDGKPSRQIIFTLPTRSIKIPCVSLIPLSE